MHNDAHTQQDLADADSDEWPSDSDASDDSDSDSDDDVDVSALPKGRAFWVKQAPTDDGKAKREERKAAKQEESLKKSKREKVVDLKAKVCFVLLAILFTLIEAKLLVVC
jgi:hypothetical protein